MKAFKKWWDKNPVDKRTYGEAAFDLMAKPFAEAGWKAALEWAYKQETDPQATEIGDAILVELGEL